MNRWQVERAFHDRQARQRASDLVGRLVFEDAAFLGHETWIRPAVARLGPLTGRRVLDFGCGHGMAAVVFARAGAEVIACDLSGDYLVEARCRADANDVIVSFVQADGECLPFVDASFDAVWGNAVLHHLDLDRAARELHRVLKPGGVAVFCEPWGENPLLALARRRWPYPGKQRTPDEQPLRRRDLNILRRHFPMLRVEGYQFLSMGRRLWSQRPIWPWLDRLDHRLLQAVPRLANWCRYVVLTLIRSER